MLNGNKLRELREKRGISQAEAGRRMGLCRAAINHYEQGVRTPGIDIIAKLAKLYGVKIESLLK